MKFETVRIHSLSDVFGLSSSKNFDTMAIWRNDVSSLFQPLSAFFFLEMLDATYTLGACPVVRSFTKIYKRNFEISCDVIVM